MMHELVRAHFASRFGNTGIADAAVLGLRLAPGERLALCTDSFVVSPLIFPGGDIGDLAVNGTVNDLCMAGARPLYLTAGFIIEEGLPVGTLDRIIESMARAAEAAGVSIVAGDTKVVDRGKGDGVFINTAGVGVVGPGVELGPARMEPGDVLMLTGALGRHGVAVMGERNGLTFDPPVTSDTANLARLTGAMLDAAGGGLRVMRDPTRGGLATTLKEFALESGLCMVLDEDALPVPDGVRGACGLLGLDPLYVANEGLCVAALAPDVAEYVLERARQTPEGSGACLVGRVAAGPARAVLLSTSLGGTRVLDMLEGEQLPRIC